MQGHLPSRAPCFPGHFVGWEIGDQFDVDNRWCDNFVETSPPSRPRCRRTSERWDSKKRGTCTVWEAESNIGGRLFSSYKCEIVKSHFFGAVLYLIPKKLHHRMMLIEPRTTPIMKCPRGQHPEYRRFLRDHTFVLPLNVQNNQLFTNPQLEFKHWRHYSWFHRLYCFDNLERIVHWMCIPKPCLCNCPFPLERNSTPCAVPPTSKRRKIR